VLVNELLMGFRFCLVKRYAKSVGLTIIKEDRIVPEPAETQEYGPNTIKKRKGRNY
jgi:hypothetical protein